MSAPALIRGSIAIQTYTQFIKAARAHVNRSEEETVALMRLLVETEPLTGLWQNNPYGIAEWDKLIEREELTTARAYLRFKQAARLGIDIEAIGLPAALRIARLPKAIRKRALDGVRQWIRTCKVPPSCQRVTTIIDECCPVRPAHKSTSPTKAQLKAQVRALSAYVQTLRAALRKHGVRPPSPPKGATP